MSIASEIQRIQGNIANAYTACDGKGATMPVAADQNSDNLADTISSIPTGGGGNKYDAFKSMVSNIPCPLTYADAWESGEWYVIERYRDKDTVNLIGENWTHPVVREGIYFGEEAPDIFYIYTGMQLTYGFMVPEDAEVTELTGQQGSQTYDASSPLVKIDFTNSTDKWIVLGNVPVQNGFYSLHESIAAVQANATDYFGIYSTVKYFCLFLNSSTYTESSPYTYTPQTYTNFKIGDLNSVCDFSSILEDVDIGSNLKVNFPDECKDLFYIPEFLIPKSRIFNVEKVCPLCNITYGVSAFTAAKTSSVINYYANILARCRKFPFILDGSSMSTSNNTWYIGNPKKSGTSYSDDYPIWYVPEELFIIAPNMNINWTSMNKNNAYAGNKISIRSLKFFADNAPNVSSKTLKIGDTNIHAANEADPTIISTLQSKGWTVS